MKMSDVMSVTLAKNGVPYLPMDCPNCDRRRVESTGVCEKCDYDMATDLRFQQVFGRMLQLVFVKAWTA